jgi:hypothetical protein
MSSIILKDKAYKKWLEDLKDRIQASQIKAAIRVNGNFLDLYWHFGEEITVKRKTVIGATQLLSNF